MEWLFFGCGNAGGGQSQILAIDAKQFADTKSGF